MADSRDYITMRCVQSSAFGKRCTRCRHDGTPADRAAPTGVHRNENGTRAGVLANPRARVPRPSR
ncbi:hypothetical protein WS94_18700 [Burkholderia territorii]|nr:hypothetical protein WS94_18700 [Burkholderia territorii]